MAAAAIVGRRTGITATENGAAVDIRVTAEQASRKTHRPSLAPCPKLQPGTGVDVHDPHKYCYQEM